MKEQTYQQENMHTNIITTNSLLLLFQVMGSTYPVGGFSHSFGLETYICRGEVKTVAELKEYLIWILKQNYRHFEGEAFCLAYEAGQKGDWEVWMRLDRENTAMRLSKENRQASLKMGQAFLRTAKAVFGEGEMAECHRQAKADKTLGNYCVAAGYWAGIFQIPLREALQAFLFNGINNLVQVGIKIIPLGQSESQNMLYSVYPQILEVTEQLLDEETHEVINFIPAQDIASMQHERLYSRLYMS